MKKTFFLSLVMLFLASLSSAQEAKYQLSSHILDINKGMPVAHVKIGLSKKDANGQWVFVDEKFTDENGRVKNFLKQDNNSDNQGIYKLTFYTAPYFKKLGEESFYPFVEVVFQIKGKNHYHVPITLSPFGYSTYRGS
ncbi:hydroxyisourate hydrolase [Riemerella columbipharyngis]|uniref:5-hydroxyisourate hydrolase n=1 Tax=Riemerella columbipharyngis TaxID=1071918 RepID=A0A1G7E486_9FLAO|nr:hydroxyisourate hydrolase [Riemerella columbipharyngis]SDE58276.1 5-hydroxyisourate hydrolase [Riemerella columbipharyngis]